MSLNSSKSLEQNQPGEEAELRIFTSLKNKKQGRLAPSMDLFDKYAVNMKLNDNTKSL